MKLVVLLAALCCACGPSATEPIVHSGDTEAVVLRRMVVPAGRLDSRRSARITATYRVAGHIDEKVATIRFGGVVIASASWSPHETTDVSLEILITNQGEPSLQSRQVWIRRDGRTISYTAAMSVDTSRPVVVEFIGQLGPCVGGDTIALVAARIVYPVTRLEAVQ